MKHSWLSFIVGLALAPLTVSAQDYSGQWSFFGYYLWADMEDPYDPFLTESYPDILSFQVYKQGNSYVLSIPGIGSTGAMAPSPSGDFFEFYDVDASDDPQYNFRVRLMPIDDNLMLIMQSGASFSRRLEFGQIQTVLLDFESVVGVLTRDGIQHFPTSDIEGEYAITSLSMYGSTSVSNVASFGAFAYQEHQTSRGYMKRTGNGQFRFSTGNIEMNLVDYGANELEYTFLSDENGKNVLHEIRVIPIDGDRLLIFEGEADDAGQIVPWARTEVWVARKVSDNSGDAFPFFPGAGYPDAGGWIEWKNEWFYTLDAPWFYSYRTDWTYIEGNDPTYMWWWSWNFKGTGQGEWIWTNDVYYPWVWLVSDNWYDVSTF